MKRHALKHILVPADLSEPTLSALDAAMVLGRASGADLDILYVQEARPSLAIPRRKPGKAGEKRWNAYCRFVEEKILERMRDYPRRKIRFRAHRGHVLDVLTEMTRRPSGLLVLGTHGHTGIRHIIFGSVAETMVRRSQMPVMTVHERRVPFALNRMLVPVNLTPHADGALLYALSLAEATGARVSVLHIAEGQADPRDAQRRFRARLAELLGPQWPRRHRLIVRRGSAEHGILEEAAAGKFDLVVLAAHRRRFWKDFILGMTAERILRFSPIPVLSVPSEGVPVTRRAGGRTRRS